MDSYYTDRVFEEDFNQNCQQVTQQFSSEYSVEMVGDCSRNDSHSGIADGIGSQVKGSMNHHHTSSGKLFVGGVSWSTTDESFADYFGKYGEVADSIIMLEKNTRRPRGFGFVTYVDPAVAERVLLEEHIIDGRKVELKKTVPREEIDIKGEFKTKKIFVGGIPPSLCEDELKEYFSFYGDIMEHQIMLDHNSGISRGFGFVTFQTEESVDKIFSEGKVHELGGKPVDIKKAQPKRAGREYHNGNASNSYNGQNTGYPYDSEDMYNETAGGGYNDYSGYNVYGGLGGTYMGCASGFYNGYGGYGYSFGYPGSMYAAGYGMGGYGNMMGSYNGFISYNSSKGYGNGMAYGDSFANGKESGSEGPLGSRYHPYQK